MKRSDLIEILVELYESIPDDASSYHKIDIPLGKAEREGMLAPEIKNPRVAYSSRLKYADEKALADIYGYRFKYAQEDYCVYEWEETEE